MSSSSYVSALNCRYGEIVNINLIRDKDSGKSKGFCFLCYEDQRSTVLAVDNFNGIKILNRTIRVDHVGDYKAPKEGKKTDAETKKLYQEGCAPKAQPVDIKPVIPPPQDIRETLADQIVDGVRLPPRLPIYTVKEEKLDVKEEKVELEKVKVEVADEQLKIKVKKEKKKKKDKKHKSKKKRKRESSESSERSNSPSDEKKRKKHRDEKRNKR